MSRPAEPFPAPAQDPAAAGAEPAAPGRFTVAGRTVAAVENEADYAEAARRTGCDGPLPVLPRDWQRLRATLGALPVTSDSTPRRWRGAVFVCDPAYAPAGQVLARASGRPLLHGDFGEALRASRDHPVTLVAGADTVSHEDFTAVPPDARLGLFVTRDLVTASELAVRTVLHGPAAAAHRGDLSFDVVSMEPTAPGRLTGANATVEGLRDALGDGVAVLSGRSHARECVLHLNGAGICGLSANRPLLPLAPAPAHSGRPEHLTACQQNAGCWRGDLDVPDHLRASEVRAAFVMLDGCQLALAGQGPVRADVSVPLTMLEGSAIAVAAAAGTRKGASRAGQLFQALIRGGLALGDVLSEVNGAIGAEPDAFGKLVLFGDAGLVPAPARDASRTPVEVRGRVHVPDRSDAVLLAGPSLLAERGDGPLVMRRAQQGTWWALTSAAGRGAGEVVAVPVPLDGTWRTRAVPWIRRLRDLAGLLKADPAELDGIERRAAAAVLKRARAEDAPAAEEATREFQAELDGLRAFQARLIADEVDWIRENFYTFTDNWAPPWSVRTHDEPAECPQCGGRTVTRNDVWPAGGTGSALCYAVCARCGEIASGAARFGCDVTVRAPTGQVRGEEFTVGVTVRAPADRPLAVAVGASIPNGRRLHCDMAGSRSFELGPGGSAVTEFTGVSDRARTKPDQYAVRVLVAVDGAVRCLTQYVWVRS